MLIIGTKCKGIKIGANFSYFLCTSSCLLVLQEQTPVNSARVTQVNANQVEDAGINLTPATLEKFYVSLCFIVNAII